MNVDLEMVFGMTLAAAVVAAILGLLVWSLVWVYHDAEARGKSGWLVSLLVLVLKWPVSLLGWIVFRPDLPSGGKRT